MQVAIFSMTHARFGGTIPMWIGSLATGTGPTALNVPIRWEDEEHAETVNEALFRFFNRVDEADEARLKRLRYELPSLSVGDYIAWGESTYRVASVGFTKVTGTLPSLREVI